MEITWESLEFDYAPLWNPDEHCYDGWESTENPITVINTTQNGAPVRVTLTFVPIDKMGATAAFAPCEDDPHPEDFTFSNGQVTFLLPRDADSAGQATVNLFLTGDPMGWATQQYNQIGSIKTEITPLHEGTENLKPVPPGASEIQPPPVSSLPSPKPEEKPTEPAQPAPTEPGQPEALPTQPGQPEPPMAEKPEEKPTEPVQPAPTEPGQPEALPTQPGQPEPPMAEAKPPPPAEAEGLPPEAETEKPGQESTPDAMPPPEQNSKEETQTAPHTESGAPPQEEPQ